MPQIRIGSRFFAGPDDWTQDVTIDAQGRVHGASPTTLRTTLDEGFYMSVSAGALHALHLTDLRIEGRERRRPVALGVDRHSLVNPTFLTGGRIRVRRNPTRECVPTPPDCDTRKWSGG